MKAIDRVEVGHVYGELTVLSKDDVGKEGIRYVSVMCSCGKVYDVQPYKIVSRGHRSCQDCARKRSKKRMHRVSKTSYVERTRVHNEYVVDCLKGVRDALWE